MNQTTSTAASSTISAEAISNRAYELWQNEGCPEGSDQRHWYQAEQELRGTVERNGDCAAKPSSNSDVTPLKGTRAGAAAESSAARSSGASATTTTASLGSSSPKPVGKRASASPFPSGSQKKATPAR